MSISFTILLMIFCHIVDDYYLQGWLASAKQKSWWYKNYPGSLYKHDYIWALLMHSFSWSFMIMLPIAAIDHLVVDSIFIVVFGINVLVHMCTDNMKANLKLINLWQDQIIHLLQILITAYVLL